MSGGSTVEEARVKELGPKDYVRFKRNRFIAKFPRGYRYSPAHFWMAEDGDSIWRVGLTHFATRMLGEIVEYDVEKPTGSEVRAGTVIGWIEGMKAVTDLFCVASGELLGPNPEAQADVERVCKDPYGEGWLYAVRGRPDEGTTDVETYLESLGETLDAMEDQPWKSAVDGVDSGGVDSGGVDASGGDAGDDVTRGEETK